jgi:hypothetical protein
MAYTVESTQLPNYLLQKIDTEGNGGMTIHEYLIAQRAALPYNCPNCEGTGVVTLIPVDGANVDVVCPLCAGMGKVPVAYNLATDTAHWVPTPPPPVDPLAVDDGG